MLTRLHVLRLAACFVVIFLAHASRASLHAQATTAAILGTVNDSSGAAVPGATVTATNTGTGIAQNAVSDSRGRYLVPSLTIGTYEVKAELQGFQTVVRKGVELSVGREVVVDFALPVGQLSETVTVQGAATQVDTTTTQLANLVDQSQMRSLPLNGRNVEQLILLAPGVSIYQSISAGAFYGSAPAYSVSGSRPNGQAQVLDGTNIQDYFNRGSGASVIGTSMGVDAIEEFQILTNTYSAQYGGNGSVMNAVTKSGTNSYHGTTYDFLRRSGMDAKNYFDRADLPIPPFGRDQFGATLGGPVKRDRMFFFLNYEGLTQSLGLTRVLTVPDLNARAGLLPIGPGGSLANVGVDPRVAPYMKFWPAPDTVIGGGQGIVTLNPTQTAHENYVIARVDSTFRNSDSLFVRYVSDMASQTDPAAGPIPELWPAINSNNNQFATAEEKHVWSDRVLNLLRFDVSRPWQRSQTDVNTHPEFQWFPGAGLPDGSLAIGGGIAGFGSAAPGPWQFSQGRTGIADDVYWTKGAHNLKFGASVTRVASDVYSPIPGHGGYTFNSFQLFLQASPLQYSGALPGAFDATRNFREIYYVGYVQDDWRVSPKITLNLGLRYAPTNNGTEVNDKLHRIIDPPVSSGFAAVSNIYDHNPSLNNWDPRIGIAWDPSSDHQTAIRAGFGIFHGIIGPRDFAATYYNSPPFITGVELNPLFPVPFRSVNPALPTQTFAMDMKNDLATPYVAQWNVNMQRELGSKTMATIAYVGSHSYNQVQQIQLNPPVPVQTANGPQFATLQIVNGRPAVVDNVRVNPAYDNLSSSRTIGWSRYNALQLGVNRRFSNAWSSQVSYTYSKCTDINSGSFLVDGGTTLSNPFDANADIGPCSFDIRHNLTVNGLYSLPFHGNAFVDGWQLSTIVTAHSGNPYNITTGIATQTFRGSAARPNLVAGCDPEAGQTIDHWFNAACFTLPPVGFLGNLPRNYLTGPDLVNVDASVLKTTKIVEGVTIQFRAEVFNLFNRANFGLPAGAVFAQGAVAGTGVVSPTYGRITSTRTTSRQIQIGFKLLF